MLRQKLLCQRIPHLDSRRFFLFCNVDIDTVDFHILIGTDQDIFDTTDDAGLNQIAAGGIALDDHIRGLDLKVLVVDDILGMQVSFKAKDLVIIHAEL